MPSSPTFTAVSIEGDDASALAAFYAGLLGWEITFDADGMAAVEGDGQTLYFSTVDDHVPAGWPSDHQRFHFDLAAPDPDAFVSRVEDLGGRLPEHQPATGSGSCFLDPSGQPFCISRRDSSAD